MTDKAASVEGHLRQSLRWMSAYKKICKIHRLAFEGSIKDPASTAITSRLDTGFDVLANPGLKAE